MRLFLASQNLEGHTETLVDLVGSNKKVAYIANAKDDWSKRDRKAKVAEHKVEFKKLGFEFKEIDLRDYFDKPEKLLNKLSNFGLVWCSGGNTFILRRAMAASYFDAVVKSLLSEDKLVYGGSSAGSCVAAPTLRGIDQGDRPEPDVVPKNYPIKKTIWDGLNLVPYMIVPHYGSDWFAKEANATIRYLKKHKLPYKELKDGQAIVINGDNEEILK